MAVATVRASGSTSPSAVADHRGAEVARDVGERMVRGVPEAERLGNRHRPVHEIGLGSEQRHARAIARQLAQRDQRLQGGDAASGDEDVRRR